MMHLSLIGSVGVRTNLSAEVAFQEQEVQELSVDLVAVIDNETILMAKDAGFEVGAVDFELGQLVFVPVNIS